ncbi:hypothetical protein WN51_06558 [Melipona quadrifasciata]|uniref:Uncharacterized protein n=1 Tax=Melipona quadrifasciata TaxID=166423 RepID=A0A0N1IT52_9HYME|nr:hypothetical protein WN51_06558 [Melipona quadrifasciata]
MSVYYSGYFEWRFDSGSILGEAGKERIDFKALASKERDGDDNDNYLSEENAEDIDEADKTVVEQSDAARNTLSFKDEKFNLDEIKSKEGRIVFDAVLHLNKELAERCGFETLIEDKRFRIKDANTDALMLSRACVDLLQHDFHERRYGGPFVADATQEEGAGFPKAHMQVERPEKLVIEVKQGLEETLRHQKLRKLSPKKLQPHSKERASRYERKE